MRLGRWARTIAHLEPEQVWHRGRLTARRWLWQRISPRIDARYRDRARALGQARWNAIEPLTALRRERHTIDERIRIADDALLGRFSFLNQSKDLGRQVTWQRADLDSGTRLWKTLLHEHPYAEDLAFAYRHTGSDAYRDRFWDLVQSWSAPHPIGCPDFAKDVWNARAVANRMLSWSVAAQLSEPAGRDADALSHHLATHALFLHDNMEWDLGGNHLIRDLLGLLLASVLFPKHLAFRRDAVTWLEREVLAQVLADGCHIERTPLYHAVVLRDLVEARALFDAPPSWLDDAITRMASFLRSILHGDGELPLFGDSWLGEIDPQRVLAEAHVRTAEETTNAVEPVSGLVALSIGDAKLIIRAGAHGPDHQLGHAHADLLSFELSLGPHRIVTDTGTGTYDMGAIRVRTRSTAAHNTIQIDSHELLEAWSSFRVGRRGRASIVLRGEAGGVQWLWARHDAYRHLGVRHDRLFALNADLLVVIDAVDGAHTHRASSRLHLHPDRPATHVEPLGGEAHASGAPFYERFGAEPRVLDEVTTHYSVPCIGGWLITLGPGQPSDQRWQADHREAQLDVTLPGNTLSLRWSPDTLASPRIVTCPTRVVGSR